ncbi:hypothetical protein F4556_002391 [Kitasatospora gansuensis]|uniref:Uncharacterized protein n=1 Tax=Kitasatospora gansuensis TaxID=258050 RepID=A0A7W7SCG8_9ACTN|nr:hypothetical protein [Kitasatospora gansuensis]MBB4946856.1 hypothetical protein [Kitasatospora gansuensis]
MRPAPISDERLASIRALSLAVLVPQSETWSGPARRRATVYARMFAPVLRELLDEIAELDADLDSAEAELAAERARAERLAARLPRPTPRSRPSITRRAGGRWQVRWSEDGGRRRSATVSTKHEARQYADYLMDLARRGGAR